MWVSSSACRWIAATTSGAVCPTFSTAMPVAKSIRRLPSTSSTMALEARAVTIGWMRADARGHRVRAPIEPLAGPRARDLGDELAFLRDVHRTSASLDRRRLPAGAPRPAASGLLWEVSGPPGRLSGGAATIHGPARCPLRPFPERIPPSGGGGLPVRPVQSIHGRHRQGHPRRARAVAAPAGRRGRRGRAGAVGPRERAGGPDPVAAGWGAAADDRHERRVRRPPRSARTSAAWRGPASRASASVWGSITTRRRGR